MDNIAWQYNINNKIANNTLNIQDLYEFYRYEVGFNSSDWEDNNDYEIGICENNILWDNILELAIQDKLIYLESYDDFYSKINYFISLFGSRLDWSILIAKSKINMDNIYKYSGIIIYQNCEDLLLQTQTLSNEFIEEFYIHFKFDDLFKYQKINEDTIEYLYFDNNDNFNYPIWRYISRYQKLSKNFIIRYIRYLTIDIIVNNNADLSIKLILLLFKKLNNNKIHKYDSLLKNRLKPRIVKYWITKYRKNKKSYIKKILVKKNIPNELIDNILRSYYL